MNVVIAALYETDQLRAAELRWPLRLAARHGGDVTVLVPATGEGAKAAKVDLSEGADDDPLTRELGVSLRALLDQELTPEGWVASGRQSSTEDGTGDPRDDGPTRVTLRTVSTGQMAATALSLIQDANRDLLVNVTQRLPKEGTAWRTLSKEMMRDAHCQVVHVATGRREAEGEILFEPAHAQYARGAAPLAMQLAKRHHRKATGLWIEPEIGPDAERVGRQMLERVLKDTLGDEHDQAARRVEVLEPPERGILRACADERYEVVVLGISRLGAAGFAEARTAVRVARGTDQPTLMFVRGALPPHARWRRFLSYHLHRIVPQLQRAERSAFVSSVQTSSEWNFDFIALMGLATGIATLGLVGDSGAVIIGAMLVAPLMTPLMGIGLSIVQGNLRLAAMTSRTAFLGFVLAFATALSIGLLDREFGIATGEMLARHWPSLVDLGVAFVAGLAAAYASGRPGLLAALPGVAIAASLVPPIATSGLAVSIGNYDLAIGAILLFAVNVVAIVFASAVVLRAVGLGGRRERSLQARLLATGVGLVAIATTIAIAVSPPRAVPPLELVEAIEAALGGKYRVREIRIKDEGGPLLQIDIGGSLREHPAMGDDLRKIALEHLGEDATVRLTYRHESLLH